MRIQLYNNLHRLLAALLVSILLHSVIAYLLWPENETLATSLQEDKADPNTPYALDILAKLPPSPTPLHEPQTPTPANPPPPTAEKTTDPEPPRAPPLETFKPNPQLVTESEPLKPIESAVPKKPTLTPSSTLPAKRTPKTKEKAKPKPKPKPSVVATPQVDITPNDPAPAVSDASSLIRSALSLAANGIGDETVEPIANSLNAHADDPVFAAYLRGWTEKVERIGRLNYPTNLVTEGSSRSLTLDATVGHTGQLLGIQIIRSSGDPELDEAARRILKLAAPFLAFPPQMARQHTELRITRRWSFENRSLGVQR